MFVFRLTRSSFFFVFRTSAHNGSSNVTRAGPLSLNDSDMDTIGNSSSLTLTGPIAVEVAGAYKSYGSGKKKVPVLQNLHMTVPKGAM